MLKDKLDIIIRTHNFLETTDICLQLLRNNDKFNDNTVYLFISDPTLKNDPKIDKFRSYGNINIDFSKELLTGRQGAHETYFETLENYLTKYEYNPEKFVICTFQDHWVLRPNMLYEIIRTVNRIKYEGMCLYTGIDKNNERVYHHSFHLLKAKYLINILQNYSKFKENFIEVVFKKIFENVNLYHPSKESYDQYFYNALLGVGHFHLYKQKKHYIWLYENETGKKLDYDDELLQKEESIWTANDMIGIDLNDDISLKCKSY